MKLMIGAGRTRREGWHTLDANPKLGTDFVGEVPPLPPDVKGHEWKEIESIHFHEHLYLWDAENLTKEVYEVLVGGGRFVLECPNIMYAAKVMCGMVEPKKRTDQYSMWPLYGDPTHKDPLFGHRWGYTPETLEAQLKKAGFSQVLHERARSHIPERDFRIVGVK